MTAAFLWTMQDPMASFVAPPSPTLTNPDMILPELDSAYSPAQDLQRPWQGSELNYSIGPAFSLTPITPIIYGQGTMLSDIGEVTENESPAQLRTRPGAVRVAIRDLTLGSSPTMGYKRGGTHVRTVSAESVSTVTSEGQAAVFDSFDDSISIDDSNFQGDDEESVFGDNSELSTKLHQPHNLVRKESSIGQDEDRHSSAALSRRAEMILANAKQRLEKMEGNLERARTSFVTPSSSISSISSSSPFMRSTPSPTQRLVTQLGVPPSMHRTLQNSASSPASPGHSRVFSENNIPSSMSTNRYFVRSSSAAPIPSGERLPPSKATTRYPVRSASAAAVFRETTKVSLPQDSVNGRSNQVSALNHNSPPHARLLEPLSEDDTIFNLESSRTSIAESHFSTADESRSLTRSISSMQMRDLRDQMKDLKGKISSLRDRAREENMKRRSLQSLRTPSPFTAAEQWYTQGTTYNEKIHRNDETGQNTWNDDAQAAFDVQSTKKGEFNSRFDTATSFYDDVQEEPAQEYTVDEEFSPAVQNVSRQIEVTSREDNYEEAVENINEVEDMDTEYGSDYGEEVVDYEELDGYPSESEASFYHEALETPVSHEDREDAFDYQNFFLHSAMGSISRQGDRRDSFDSYDSDDSAETARGIISPSGLPKNEPISILAPIHRRKLSGDSISTLATFATASEGHDEDQSPASDGYLAQHEGAPTSRSLTPVTARRDTFPVGVSDLGSEQQAKISTTLPSSTPPLRSPPFDLEDCVVSSGPVKQGNQPNVKGILKHSNQQPSVSSFSSSVGTARSFPLVRPKAIIHTPSPILVSGPGSSKENLNLASISQIRGLASPMNSGSGSDRCESESPDASWKSVREDSPVNMLVREDQVLVERVVASLGKCVLAMGEVSRGSTEGRIWRRRLETARKVLEGTQEATSPDF